MHVVYAWEEGLEDRLENNSNHFLSAEGIDGEVGRGVGCTNICLVIKTGRVLIAAYFHWFMTTPRKPWHIQNSFPTLQQNNDILTRGHIQLQRSSDWSAN